MSQPGIGAGQANGSSPIGDGQAGSTGRYLLVLADDVRNDERAMTEALQSIPAVSSVVSASDFTSNILDVEQADQADAQLFPALGIAVVKPDADGLASLTAAAEQDERIESIEPEQMVFALTAPGSMLTPEYLRGFRDAASELYDHINGGTTDTVREGQTSPSTTLEVAAQFVDTPALTWGLQAAAVATSTATGQGVRIAVLDTGFDLNHPDFAGRNIVSASFVQGQAVQDGHGHGTHCTGTACGPAQPPGGSRRYGCASRANIFIGKVLSNQGSGTDAQVLAGMNWAITNRCRVISMSLGAAVPTPSAAYDAVGRRALAAKCLIVAAAGNSRAQSISVGRPANSPHIMAVGAVDPDLQLGGFSATSGPLPGAGVDIAGPGVRVYSSWPVNVPPNRYNTISGTSMATPHVAGIAAMWSQLTGATGTALWGELTRTAKRLSLPSVDVGCGLVQAP